MNDETTKNRRRRRKAGGAVTGTKPKARPDRRSRVLRRDDGGELPTAKLIPNFNQRIVPEPSTSNVGSGPPKPAAVQPPQDNVSAKDVENDIKAVNDLTKGSGPDQSVRRGGRVIGRR